MNNAELFGMTAPDPIEITSSDGLSMILLDGPEICLTDLGLTIREGTWCEKDDECGYLPDWSLTLIYPSGDTPENYLYYEQDSPSITLYHFLRAIGMETSLEEVEKMIGYMPAQTAAA